MGSSEIRAPSPRHARWVGRRVDAPRPTEDSDHIGHWPPASPPLPRLPVPCSLSSKPGPAATPVGAGFPKHRPDSLSQCGAGALTCSSPEPSFASGPRGWLPDQAHPRRGRERCGDAGVQPAALLSFGSCFSCSRISSIQDWVLLPYRCPLY